jgi:hypothetical protein
MSIMAEVIATRYGGTGLSMSDKWRRSHDAGSGAGSASPAGATSTAHAG